MSPDSTDDPDPGFRDALLDALVKRPKSAVIVVNEYMEQMDGAHFLQYGFNDPGRINADDLVAVAMLSMTINRGTSSGITPSAAVAIERRSMEITSLLDRLPTDRELHTLQESDFEQLLGLDSPGADLYELLKEALRAGTDTSKKVATSKLLARKRPHLIPIRDSAARRALGNGGSWWHPWWRGLTSDSAPIDRIRSIRDRSEHPDLPLLRVADIVIWSRYRNR